MVEQDQQVRSYLHLAQFPRADDALRMLKKVASAVQPIMRSHKWRVGELAEFYPNQTNLLGLNVNRGQQICLRLRYPGDKTLFMSLDMVIDTMLHELCHNAHGPHNDAFHALWEKLRDEHLTLTLSGYSGASFLSEGRRLGGSAAPVPARQRSRLLGLGSSGGGRTLGSAGIGLPVAAEARGRRLGGAVTRVLTPEMRRAAAAEAAERRKRALEGCGADRLSETQIIDMGETARRNGFRTQAEEDKANDVAIAQALAELMADEEARQQQQRPTTPLQPQRPSAAASSSSSGTRTAETGSRTAANGRTPPAVRSPLVEMMRQGGRGSRGSSSNSCTAGWVCPVCTLHNPSNYLCCDACGSERKRSGLAATESATVIDLTQEPS